MRARMVPRPNGGTPYNDPICANHFRAVVNVGQIVKYNEEYKDVCYPANPSQNEIIIRFFATCDPKTVRSTKKACRISEK